MEKRRKTSEDNMAAFDNNVIFLMVVGTAFLGMAVKCHIDSKK